MSLASSRIDLKNLAREAEKLHPWIVERRRYLHQNPELSFKEEKTSAWLREQIKEMGLEPSPPVRPDRYGFYVDLKSPNNPDEFVLLRGDFDALPIQEENEIDFRSKVDGTAHLCGHDGHTAMLLGAVKILKDLVEELPVSVRFVFQHAEEVAPGGARDFIEGGATRDVIGCFGLHVSPRAPSWTFGVREGEAMAAVGIFEATITGRGGHGAMPHEGIDPIPAASNAVLALQQIVSRRVPPSEPTVVSVTTIHGGTAFNILPGEVKISGTFRTFTPGRVEEIESLIVRTIENAAETYGCKADVEASHSYPPLCNDHDATMASCYAIREMFGEEAIYDIELNMGAEDFAYFAQDKPSSFVFLGCLPEGETFYPLHHCRFLPDERMFWRGSALLASMPFVAPEYLKEK